MIGAELLVLQREDPDKEISMYINSPGGSISAGLAIYDTIQLVSAPVSTIAVGMTASMGTILLCCGTRGRRYALPNSTVPVSYTHLRAHETVLDLVCRLLLEKKNNNLTLCVSETSIK